MKKLIILFIVCLIIKNSFAFIHIFDGYTDKLSYRAGETVKFFLNGSKQGAGTAFLYDINGQSTSINISGFDTIHTQSYSGSEPWKDGFRYSETNEWTIPTNILSIIPSGLYFLNNQIPFIIKGDNNVGGAEIVIVVPTNTDAAYNSNGGKCLYDFCSDNCIASTTVTIYRPWAIQHQYASFLQWMTTQNYTYSVISDADMDDYNEIANARLIILPGHSEYWTRKARGNFDRFVDIDGKDGIVLSGNAMWWQVYLEVDDSDLHNVHPIMTCDRGSSLFMRCNNQIYGQWIDDPNCDPLLRTYTWPDVSLKYSTLVTELTLLTLIL